MNTKLPGSKRVRFFPVTNFYNSKKNGFTLVELMIAIVIIAVLAVVGVVVYSGVQKNARDARRKADINNIAKALETGYSSGTPGLYVGLTANMFSGGNVPADPSGGNGCGGAGGGGSLPCKYCVRNAAGVCLAGDTTVAVGAPAAGSTFIICATLENAAAANTSYCKSNIQ